MDKSKLSDLIERVEKATGEPDWELDRDIGLAIGGWELKEAAGYENFGPMLHTHDGIYMNSEGAPSPSFIESLDAAIDLVERVLPGWEWHVGKAGEEVDATINEIGRDTIDVVKSASRSDGNAALALLVALLQALSIKETE